MKIQTKPTDNRKFLSGFLFFTADFFPFSVPYLYQVSGSDMATIQKRGDKYRAIVRKRGYTQTATFTRKRDAEHWAREVEIAIENGTLEVYESLSFGDVLRRYQAEVTPAKKSAAKEALRLQAFLRDFPGLCSKPIERLNRRDVALWRDARLADIAPASVNREWNTLSAAYTHAVKVWGLSLPDNPFR